MVNLCPPESAILLKPVKQRPKEHCEQTKIEGSNIAIFYNPSWYIVAEVISLHCWGDYVHFEIVHQN